MNFSSALEKMERIPGKQSKVNVLRPSERTLQPHEFDQRDADEMAEAERSLLS